MLRFHLFLLLMFSTYVLDGSLAVHIPKVAQNLGSKQLFTKELWQGRKLWSRMLRLRGGMTDAFEEPKRKMNVLLGVTGSVASIKVQDLVAGISAFANVQVVATTRAMHFFDADALDVRVWKDDDEWNSWHSRGDPVQHIDLRQWADIFVIAPLSANTLAKITNGMCDNLITCIARAWPVTSTSKKMIVAPAMNTLMWEHPITSRQMEWITTMGGMDCIYPITKVLMCGEQGVGAMAHVEDICRRVKSWCDRLGQQL